MWQNERAFVDHMNFLKSIGATIINTSDQSFSIQHQWNTPLSNKKVLNADEWEVLTKGSLLYTSKAPPPTATRVIGLPPSQKRTPPARRHSLT